MVLPNTADFSWYVPWYRIIGTTQHYYQQIVLNHYCGSVWDDSDSLYVSCRSHQVRWPIWHYKLIL